MILQQITKITFVFFLFFIVKSVFVNQTNANQRTKMLLPLIISLHQCLLPSFFFLKQHIWLVRMSIHVEYRTVGALYHLYLLSLWDSHACSMVWLWNKVSLCVVMFLAATYCSVRLFNEPLFMSFTNSNGTLHLYLHVIMI